MCVDSCGCPLLYPQYPEQELASCCSVNVCLKKDAELIWWFTSPRSPEILAACTLSSSRWPDAGGSAGSLQMPSMKDHTVSGSWWWLGVTISPHSVIEASIGCGIKQH